MKKKRVCYLPMDMARIVSSVTLLFYRQRRLTLDGKPYKGRIVGGGIVAANHTAFSDPFVLGGTFWRRRMYFLAAENVMGGKLRSWLLRGVGCIRIDRNQSDIGAIRQSVEVLKRGKLLAIFPQGQIGDMSQTQIKSGTVLIALQAKAPVIPVYVHYPAKKWGRVTVVVGEPLHCHELCNKRMPSLAEIDELSNQLSERMNQCREAYEIWEEKNRAGNH